MGVRLHYITIGSCSFPLFPLRQHSGMNQSSKMTPPVYEQGAALERRAPGLWGRGWGSGGAGQPPSCASLGTAFR